MEVQMISQNAPPPESDPKNLIVNYIPTPVTDAELRKLFAPFGTVESARVILDRATNHPKGYGFVKYTTEEAAKKAIRHMNGFELGNKRLRVTQANGPQNRSIQQYSDRIVYLQQAPMAPMTASVPIQMPMPYTFVGNGQPGYPKQMMPTVMLAQPNGTMGFMPQQANNTYFVEVNGEPMRLVSQSAMPFLQQQQAVFQQGQMPAQDQNVQAIQPLCFAPFQPGNVQADPMMHSSFQLSVQPSTMNSNSQQSFDMKSSGMLQ